MDRYHYEPATFIVQADLNALRNRLDKGQIIHSRIVLVLEKNKYLIRMFGYNLVMESRLSFNRFDEVIVKVKKVSPRLELALLRTQKDKNNAGDGHRSTDIII